MPSARLPLLSNFSRATARNCRGFLILFFCASGLSVTARAQACSPPWSDAVFAYGTIHLTGSGSGTTGSPPVTTSYLQQMTATLKLQSLGPGSCLFIAEPPTAGAANDFVFLDDMEQYGCAINDTNKTQTIENKAIGPGNAPAGSLEIGVPGAGAYTLEYSDGGVDATEIQSGCSNSSGSFTANVGSPSLADKWMGLSLTGTVAQGVISFSEVPFDNFGTGVPADWTVQWSFSPVPGDDCKPCKDKRGSEVSLQSQSLGENIAIVGTPFYLHYKSGRALGHAGADVIAAMDAHSLGGWTLNVHHVLEPTLLAWCVGGACTPYAIVPKALFLGDGSSRNDSDVQSAISFKGNLYLTSEDGAEVYEFNNYVHTRTLRPMTGALLYSFGYDSNGQLVKISDAVGNVTAIHRAANGSPTAIISPYGQTTTLTVDANGFLSEVTDPGGHTIKLSNDSTGLLASLTDANDHTYTFEYDSFGRVVKDSDPAGGSLTLTRTDNSTGYGVSEKTALGVTSEYETSFSSVSGLSTTQQFTNTWPSGLKATETDTQLLGKISQTFTLPDGTKDSKTSGRDPIWGIQVPVITSETLTEGSLSMKITGNRTASLSTTGDPFALVSVTDKQTINGRTYTSVFTAADRSYVETTPVGRTFTTLLDSRERVSSSQVAGLTSTGFAYDPRGRLSAITQGTRKTIFTYDTDGRLTEAIDPLDLKTSYTYDADGHRLTATLPDGRVIGYKYDANGNLTSVTPPGKNAHDFEYTAVNLLSEYHPPSVLGTGVTIYTYNPDRDLTRITRPDGKLISFDYDDAGRLSSVVTPTKTIDYSYSSTTGNLESALITGGESLAYGYNGPLQTSTKWTGTIDGTVGYAYNDNFWITTEIIDGGNEISFAYDNDGLVTKAGAMSVTNNANNGLISGTTLDSATDTHTYNTFGELTGYTAAYSGSPLLTVTYTRDAGGRVASRAETIGDKANTYIYHYDLAGRLTGVTQNSTAISSYSYDTNSNRVKAVTFSGSISATYDAQDRMLTYGSASFTYTANGELASQTVGAAKTTYSYDVLGNLVAVALPTGKTISYIVDAQNRRVGKKVSGVLTEGFLYDQKNRILAQLNGSNAVVSQFVYATGNHTPDYMISGGATYRIFSDQLGSPRLIVNAAAGSVAEEITYDEFGNVLNDTNPGFQPFGFAGGLYDQDTKLIRFGARDYSASTGRWTAKDPIRFAGGDANLYGYAVNDPVSLYDFTGLEGEADGGTELAGKVGEAVVETCEKTIHAKGDQIIEQNQFGEYGPPNLTPTTGRRLNEYVDTNKPAVENVESTWNLWERLKKLWDDATKATKTGPCPKCQNGQTTSTPTSDAGTPVPKPPQARDAGWDFDY